MSVGMPETLLLQEFGELIWNLFDEIPYHVGSSLENKTGWRDVDVRLMLPDDEWERRGYGVPGNEHCNERWRRVCIALSKVGREMTGLPIDFQIQQLTYANKTFPRKEKHDRSALFVVREPSTTEGEG